jgi:hypothetical protein
MYRLCTNFLGDEWITTLQNTSFGLGTPFEDYHDFIRKSIINSLSSSRFPNFAKGLQKPFISSGKNVKQSIRVEYNPKSTSELVELLEKDGQNKSILHLVWDYQIEADWQQEEESDDGRGRAPSKSAGKNKRKEATKKVKKEVKSKVKIFITILLLLLTSCYI